VHIARRHIKAEALRLGYKNSSHITEADFVLALLPEDIIKRQLKAAIQAGDVFRAQGKESELKDLALDRTSPDALSLNACTLLRSPENYSDGAWLSSRSEARIGMRRWQNSPLVTSLTPLNGLHVSKAKAIFKDIQCFMGDIKSRKGDAEVDQYLRLNVAAAQNSSLRPERKWTASFRRCFFDI
jgi:hypothetical protein